MTTTTEPGHPMSRGQAPKEWAVKAAERCLGEAREYAVCRFDTAHPATVGGGARIEMARIIASSLPGVVVDRERLERWSTTIALVRSCPIGDDCTTCPASLERMAAELREALNE